MRSSIRRATDWWGLANRHGGTHDAEWGGCFAHCAYDRSPMCHSYSRGARARQAYRTAINGQAGGVSWPRNAALRASRALRVGWEDSGNVFDSCHTASVGRLV